MNQVPPIEFALRSKEGVIVHRGPPCEKPDTSFAPVAGATVFGYSSSGTHLAVATATQVHVYSADGSKDYPLLVSWDVPGVQDLKVSPQGSFVTLFSRYVTNSDAPNVFIYSVANGVVLSYRHKLQSSWAIEWSEDERFLARLVNHEVHIYDAQKLGKGATFAKLALPNLSQFSISPGRRPVLAVFVPETKGSPATVRLYTLTNLNTPISAKTFFKADYVTFLWNDLGTNLLAWVHTDMDTTGGSYYGESFLYYLATAGNYDCRVTFSEKGAIHDVAWSPTGKEFAVVYGSMPSKVTLFDHRADPVFDFPRAHYNFARYSPNGRFVAIAGFGNLQGKVDIYDRKTLKQTSTIRAPNTTACTWSPDSRFLLTAIFTPRLRVDNGYHLYHYSGGLVAKFPFNELYALEWKPTKAAAFSERHSLAPCPPTIGGVVGDVAQPAKPAVYRPSFMQGRASFMARGPPGAGPARTVPGAIPGMGGAKPAPKKTVPQIKKVPNQAIERVRDESSPVSPMSPSVIGVTAPKEAAPVDVTAISADAAKAADAARKRVKALLKKMSEIRALKARQQRGETLEPLQLKKVSLEAEYQAELDTLSKML